jgi:hypothetical protein
MGEVGAVLIGGTQGASKDVSRDYIATAIVLSAQPCYSCRMVRRAIEIDEDTDRILTELASEYNGDLSRALADLIHAYEGLEAFADRSEAAHEDVTRAVRDRSEADFGEGRTVTWEDVKARNGL